MSINDFHLVWVPASGIGQMDRNLEDKIKKLLGVTGIGDLLSKRWAVRPGDLYLLTRSGYEEILSLARREGDFELTDRLEQRRHCWFPSANQDSGDAPMDELP